MTAHRSGLAPPRQPQPARRALWPLLAVAIGACTPQLPERASPELVFVDAPPPARSWVAAPGGGLALETGPDELSAPAPEGVGGEVPYRIFDDGTALVCADGVLARWDGDVWTQVLFPPRENLNGHEDPSRCEAFGAWSSTEALFVTGSGHLCRYEGATLECDDATESVARAQRFGTTRRSIVPTDRHAFFVNDIDEIGVFVLERGEPLGATRGLGSLAGRFRRMTAVPGAAQVVIDREVADGGSRVFGVEGEIARIEPDAALIAGDASLVTHYDTVPVAADDTFVVVDRIYVTVSCSGSDDDPICVSTVHWSEIVVLRAVDGAITEVAHVGVERRSLGPVRSELVDGSLRIRTSAGWIGLP